MPITPHTVYRLEAIDMLAADEGCLTRFDPVANLGEFERVFLDDFLEHKARQHSSLSRTVNKFREWCLFLVECAGALIRHVPWTSTNRPLMRGSQESAVVIGTYGGEHVGDSAILGGVLMRLYDSGTRNVALMSHRPDHTRWITKGISTPIDIKVIPYRAESVDRLLDESGKLVLAGGPLGDHPRLLVKHLAAIGSARLRRRPFLVEGIGIQHAFRHPVNQWAVRQIMRLVLHLPLPWLLMMIPNRATSPVSARSRMGGFVNAESDADSGPVESYAYQKGAGTAGARSSITGQIRYPGYLDGPFTESEVGIGGYEELEACIELQIISAGNGFADGSFRGSEAFVIGDSSKFTGNARTSATGSVRARAEGYRT